MKLETIYELWQNDSKIDPSNVGNEAINIPSLHYKYLKILTDERLLLKKYDADLKKLRLDKQEFFLLGPTQETREKGWELPPSGKVMRSDLSTYIDADQDVINLTLKYGVQKEKISVLESIIQSINSRNFNITNFINWEKFKVGG